MKVIYEGIISGHSFQMVDDTVIEVWSDLDNERPESFIFVTEGSIKSRKDFDYEIMLWASKNTIV
jgi:hypothetical protein